MDHIWARTKLLPLKIFHKFSGFVSLPRIVETAKKTKRRVFHHKDTKVSFLFFSLGRFQFAEGRQISVPLAAFGFRVPECHKSAGRFCRGFVWILAPIRAYIIPSWFVVKFFIYTLLYFFSTFPRLWCWKLNYRPAAAKNETEWNKNPSTGGEVSESTGRIYMSNQADMARH